MFISGYANTEKVFYCLIAKLTTTELPRNSLSGHPIPSVFLFLKAALPWKGPVEEYSMVRSQLSLVISTCLLRMFRLHCQTKFALYSLLVLAQFRRQVDWYLCYKWAPELSVKGSLNIYLFVLKESSLVSICLWSQPFQIEEKCWLFNLHPNGKRVAGLLSFNLT